MKKQNKTVSTKRKAIIAIVIVLVIAVVAVCINAIIEKDTDKFLKETTESRFVDGEAVAGKIGAYACTVKSAEKCKDFSGRDAVKITYIFTNNSDDAQYFDVSLLNRVYQNNTLLETTYIENESEKTVPETAPNQSSEISFAYVLNDQTSNLKVEFEEALEYDGEVLTYEVELQ